MFRNSLAVALIALLALAGAWQAGFFNDQDSLKQLVDLSGLDQQVSQNSDITNGLSVDPNTASTQTISNWADKTSQRLRLLLDQQQWLQAVATIDDAYSQANSEQLNRFKSIIFQTVNDLRSNDDRSASALLLAYAETFDDVDAWRQLGSVAAKLGDWDTAVIALLKSSAQEYEPQAYEASLRALLRAASYARATLEQRDDQLSILALYQRLYDLHPNYTRFQLELAQAHLRLNDYLTAKSYLDPLVYDTELGAIAEQILATIDSAIAGQEPAQIPPQAALDANARASDIKVPLIRAGSSLLVDVSINSSSMRLLLDTGASITALSSDTIRRLGLRPTGQSISLSTANGITQSQLYRTDRLRLGQLRLKNLIVAEVDLGRSGQVEGLLGTDALKQVGSRFSYLIDDQANALIFREKK